MLFDLKKIIEKETKDTYTCCVIMRYPHGKIGIGKHKDKEMIAGTTIAGLSLGSTRSFEFTYGTKKHLLKLLSGSLYVMKPPTNTFWTHEIKQDIKIDQARISLTFRNYQG